MSEEKSHKDPVNETVEGSINETVKDSINKKIDQEENPYLNNPLHGIGLKTILEELVTHYGFDILYAYLNINCFRSNPSLTASAKFLKKTDWAREKVEVFYLYQYKNLPAVSSEQFKLAPRERIVPEHHKPREPAILSIDDGERLQNKRAKNASYRNNKTGERKGSSKSYNEQRKHLSDSANKSKNKFYKNTESDSFSDSDHADTNDSPVLVKDPWANFKKRK